jgi:hypothetical protein
MHTRVSILSLLALVPACTAPPGTDVDRALAACLAVRGADVCTDACGTASLEAGRSCADVDESLPGYDAYYWCVYGCAADAPHRIDCGGRAHPGCECHAACARSASPEIQRMTAESYECVQRVAAGACD